MSQTLLMKLTALAGLACSTAAFGQQSVLQFELVLDNDPRLAAMGVNYGSNARLPGPQATAVGVTFIARATTEGTTPNFGMWTFGGGGSNSLPNSIFYHNDAISNQTTPAWTSAGLALSRGNIDANTSPTAPRGLMNYTQPVNYSGAGEAAQSVNWRYLIGGANQNRNSARINGTQTVATNQSQPTNNGYNNYASNGFNANNANGWVGVNRFGDFDGTRPATAANSYPNTPGSAAILAVTASRVNVPTTFDAAGDPIPTLVNYGGSAFTTSAMPVAIPGFDQDSSQGGVQSPWQAVYRMVFSPRPFDGVAADGLPNGARDVTVFMSGVSGTAFNLYVTPFTDWQLYGDNPTSIWHNGNASITFQVPGPTSAAALVIAMAFTRRRQR